ncbi:MAG TPA: hypothetical protein VNX25_02125, partial [Verrucomicrobiae bacterium]|nr:hypothetical protein [Verrucomicrobiae bacterium]
ELQAQLRPEGVELSWSAGEPAAGYLVLRRERVEGDCETCPNAYGEIRKIDTSVTRPSVQGRFRIVDLKVTDGRIYRYRVVALGGDGSRSAPSPFAETAVVRPAR